MGGKPPVNVTLEIDCYYFSMLMWVSVVVN